MSPKYVLIAVLVCQFGKSCLAQDVARAAAAVEAESAARAFFNSEDYDKAVPILERAVKESPDDLTDFGLLGMAYLYSSSHVDLSQNIVKARETMDTLIERGGEAVFLVGKADDPLKSMSAHIVKAIQGELHINKTMLRFSPSRSANGAAGPFGSAEIKECGLNKGYGKDSNSFHIKLAKGTINFRPLHFSEDESNLVCKLVGKYLGAKVD